MAPFLLIALQIVAIHNPIFVSTPVAAPAAGTYSGTQSVAITALNSVAIYYTTDGSTPTCSKPTWLAHGTLYSTAISVAANETLEAIGCAIDSYSSSTVLSAAYIIGGDTPFITGQTLGGLRNDDTGCIGFGITAPATSSTVTQLGRWIVAGNSGTHTLMITDGGGTSLGSCSLNTVGQTSGQYAYCSITPVIINAGTNPTNFIYSEETNGGDQWYGGTGGIAVTSTAMATITHDSYASISGGNCNTGGGFVNAGSFSFVPVNFLYH